MRHYSLSPVVATRSKKHITSIHIRYLVMRVQKTLFDFDEEGEESEEIQDIKIN